MVENEKTLKMMDRDPDKGFVAQNPNSKPEGLAVAKREGYPDLPNGYHWASRDGKSATINRDSREPSPSGEVSPQLAVVKQDGDWKLVNVDPNVVKPKYVAGSPETHAISSSEKPQTLLKDRDQYRQERDRLQSLKDTNPANFTEAQQKQLSRAIYEVNERSRQIGEIGAQSYMQQKHPGAERVYGGSESPSRSGDFDQVWRIPGKGQNGGDLYVVIEAKGGGSPLGTRRVNKGRQTASQGTREYFDEIARSMSADKKSKKAQEVGDDLADARARGDIQYLEVRTRIDNDNQGNSVIGNVTAKEFDIYNP
jgi:osmotically-inducible protein OsmY